MRFVLSLLAGLILALGAESVTACCAVGARGRPVVNADQTVILLWDKERKTEHFIRRASFRGAGESVGFLVPTPSRPQLEESGDAAFPYLEKITEPPRRLSDWTAGAAPLAGGPRSVQVIEEKTIAGFDVVVLAADSGKALVEWLQAHGFAYTDEAAAWAQPYLEGKWYMTAMKVAKGEAAQAVTASALRISFETDRPLFPYREPDSRKDAQNLRVAKRTLRIFFVGEARYEGQFAAGPAWKSRTTWSHPLAEAQRAKLLQLLKLPAKTGPATFWLTEFQEQWEYGKAPGDVYFAASKNQWKVGLAPLPRTVVLP